MAIALVLVLLALTIINFALELMALEVFALLVMVILTISGILPPQEAFLGFASPAVVMIAGIMILTGGVIHNGAADILARKIQMYAGSSERRMGALLLGTVSVISAVINNVAATAMFIPVAEAVAHRFKVNRARYLLPLAYASMTGGMCTLIGTSTNVAVAGALEQYGVAPLRMFELLPIGILVSSLGLLYFLYVVPHLLRPPAEREAVEAYGIKGFLYEIVVHEDAVLAGKSIYQSRFGQTLGLNILAIVRGAQKIFSPLGSDVIRAGDLLLVEGPAGTIPAVQQTRGLEIKSLPSIKRADLESDRVKIVEATLSYNSPFIGKSLKELNFRHRYDLSVLAVHRRGEVVIEKVGRIRLRAGDVLLIHGREEMLDRLGQEPAMVLLESVVLPRYNPRRVFQAAAILLAAITAAALGWVDAPTAFLAGGTLVMVFKCLPADAAGSYLNIRFLVMLAGMSTLGLAMERSGAARFLADGLVGLLQTDEPMVLLATFFILTVLLTQPISNAAAALLMLPIGIHAAQSIGVDPRTFAIAITVAASCSFITPLEPACLLVYSTGRYRLLDFVRVGTPLTFLALVVSMLLIPLLWPFHP